MGLGFVVMAMAARLVVAGALAGMGWLTLTYVLHTWGELCLSPVGMSAVSKLVPRRFISQSLGVWFVSFSLGELIAGRIAGNFDPAHMQGLPGLYMHVFWFAAVCAAALVALLPLLRRWMAGVR
jgi:POT family proton-dependent oligopeptide transporter